MPQRPQRPRRSNPAQQQQQQQQAPPPQTELPAIVKEIRLLRSRQARDQRGSYYIEGARIVAQALQAGVPVELGVLAPELLSSSDHSQATVAALRASGAEMVELSPSAFGGISFKENLQGIGAVVQLQEEPLDAIRLDASWVALHNVGNAGNLGAIMRTCDAVGVAGIILVGATTDPYHPAAIRASMGSLFALRMVRTSLEDFAAWKQAHGYRVIGTTPDVELEYQDIVYPNPAILLMGSERLGLASAEQEICDTLVRIPMQGTCDSLNLGVATSLILYELFRQQRLASA